MWLLYFQFFSEANIHFYDPIHLPSKEHAIDVHFFLSYLLIFVGLFFMAVITTCVKKNPSVIFFCHSLKAGMFVSVNYRINRTWNHLEDHLQVCGNGFHCTIWVGRPNLCEWYYSLESSTLDKWKAAVGQQHSTSTLLLHYSPNVRSFKL